MYEKRIKQLTVDYRNRGVAVVAINPNDPNIVYVAVRGTAAAGSPVVGGVYRLTFTNSGASSQNLTAEVAPGSVATEVVIDPTNPLVLYAGLVFITVSGLLAAPVFHRILHRFHWQGART